MARFVFKLRAVLTQRKWAERQRQRELSAVRQRLVAAQADLARIEQEVRDQNEHIRTHQQAGPVNVVVLVQHRRYLLGQQQRMFESVERIEQIRQELQDAQQRLAEAARARRMIEVLRDKQFEQWRVAQQKRELDQLDEAGMQIAFENLQAHR